MSESIFDIRESIKKWCEENGHDGFFCALHDGDSCGCKIDDLAPCDELDNIINGSCIGGKIAEPFIDADGYEYSWAIVCH